MPEEAAIKQILVETGVYSWMLAQAENEAELIRLIQDDFQALFNRCTRGNKGDYRNGKTK